MFKALATMDAGAERRRRRKKKYKLGETKRGRVLGCRHKVSAATIVDVTSLLTHQT